MSKYYAIAKGRKTGIFRSWSEVKPLVDRYPNAKYKSFKTEKEAQQFLEPNQSIETPILSDPNQITVYTDGSCVNKLGGYGYVLLYDQKEYPVAGKVPFYPTTNQVAELYAIYHFLKSFLPLNPYLIQTQQSIHIYTDSKYSIGCLTEWYHNWEKNNWKNSKNEPVANKELIQKILKQLNGFSIKFHHVKAHNGNHYNEMADKLANQGRLI